MAIRIGSRDELKIVSDEIIRLMEDGYRVFLLTGDLGAGKTTLVQHICQQLETEESVSSPTFSLVNAYSSRSMGVIYHMDFYRLNKTDDLVQIGLEEYLDSGNLCFIEWPEKIPGLLPQQTLHCFLSATGVEKRKLRINL